MVQSRWYVETIYSGPWEAPGRSRAGLVITNGRGGVRMRRYVWLVLAAGALLAGVVAGAAAAAGGEGPVTVKVGNLEVTSEVAFSPKVGSATKQTPLSITTGGEVAEADGSHPPAARELV